MNTYGGQCNKPSFELRCGSKHIMRGLAMIDFASLPLLAALGPTWTEQLAPPQQLSAIVELGTNSRAGNDGDMRNDLEAMGK